MTAFIDQVLNELLARDTKISNCAFILPSKRAGSYLLHRLAGMVEKPVFSPRVLSIEDFAQEIAGLKSVDNITSLFEFYSAYKDCTPRDEVENFETYSAWGQTLLHDFNEIDRYLIDYRAFFGYLSDIQEVNHWSLQEDQTSLMKNYLSFWNKLPVYYEQLQKQLERKGLAYQGMVYRRASEKIEDFIINNSGKYVFVGFNALNSAEQLIFQRLLETGLGEVFWDVEKTFFEDKQHDVSHFMRQYAIEWEWYRGKPFGKLSSEFTLAKNIEMAGIPKNIGQAKYVGEILSSMNEEDLQSTAVVLGDESLLLPVLNSLPPNISEVNVTMGFALRNAPVALLFEHLLKIQAGHQEKWYYKDLTTIINHPLIKKVTGGGSNRLSEKIKKENLVYLSSETIFENASGFTLDLYRLCFQSWKNDPEIAVANLQELIYLLRTYLDKDKDKLTLEFLYQFHLLFNKLNNLLQEYTHVTTLKSLFIIFKDLVSLQTVDFKGKPFSGLQLMGVLESRVLDFKNVILLSVNEGVLPSGKSSNSFIPFDLKCAYNLPTYKEKDAVYAYHFYHLLQRAENVHLVYNTESGGLNAGEKSRFLLQLEMEQQKQHQISQFSVVPKVPAISKELKVIPKTPEMMAKIREVAKRGFSPSALTTYVRNPLDFYKQYILGIRESEEVEETVAYNTLGTVVHDTLEKFYEQWIGSEITEEGLKKAISETPSEISRQFLKHYTSEPLQNGKNLLIYEVAKRYVVNFLKSEIKTLEKGNSIRILQVENKLECSLPIEVLDFPVNLKGTVDRVDEFNGKMRIIDYKTGKVEQNKVEIVEWEDIHSDYDKYSKPFQVLMYAYLLHRERPITSAAEAGIISFKNLQSGFLKFYKKDKNGRGAFKDPDITPETLGAFREQLINLILEICDPQVPFQEKEMKQFAW
ncbi:PD-(D/E)XK nuclease superfamily protein [Salinimicrobium catena]|uniref:PD-(D/E)XK nuclease superfamily protein n=1 Tax=Salinimicrobium catena TaxID=390640 RepID=A0A1H5IVY9_9FLAO|nr:PD-(D/E)XK nuclease family protein [Salinimicrobium catena]SDK81412.1 PD-(D/E)XK nuclease superfamily protein [Salinimicrobium catena]SEE44443.1 PD-(D/E)XK nuclease superfamily protein [Salinimicrobium catena]